MSNLVKKTIQSELGKAQNLIEKLKHLINRGKSLNVNIDEKILEKFNHIEQDIQQGMLKVALIGGFSEGKTSIAAAWLEKLDKSTMNISQSESSDSVIVYQVDNDIKLIDTPGLFGFKEKGYSDSEVEKYKDITKKYVSEAHLVLYVMNSVNPIKESHQEELEWLFKTLNLLPRTVFVLSRFDEVADVADEQDYQYNLKIKQDNVKNRLTSILGLTNQQQNELLIVAVAANPFGEGTEYWLNNLDEFKQLSHIEKLQSATVENIQKNGGFLPIIYEAQKSIISEILHKQIPKVEKEYEIINKEIVGLEKLQSKLSSELTMINSDIANAKAQIKNFIVDHFSSLIMRVKGCGIETFSDFFDTEIGKDGINLMTRVEGVITNQLSVVNAQVQSSQMTFNNEMSRFDNSMAQYSQWGKQGINSVLKSNAINASSVKAVRDGIVSVGKFFGADLAKFLKFKPWGATKFANGANGALAAFGIVLELYDSYSQSEKLNDFNKMISEIANNLEEQKREMLNIVNDLSIEQYDLLKAQTEQLSYQIQEYESSKEKFAEWKQEAEIIEAEFELLN